MKFMRNKREMILETCEVGYEGTLKKAGKFKSTFFSFGCCVIFFN